MRAVAMVERWIRPPLQSLAARQDSGFVVRCDLSDSVQKSMFYRGTWEPGESALIASHLNPGGVFVDVGANAGHYSLLAAGRVGPHGRVFAIEAASSTALALKATVEWNSLTSVVSVFQVAVADAPGKMVLRESPGASPQGMRYLDPVASYGCVVQVSTLDSLLKDVTAIDAIKVDVEGADLRVLHGMAETIGRCRPGLIVVEADDGQLGRFGDSMSKMRAFMDECGYRGTDLSDGVESPSIAFRPFDPSGV